MNPLAAFLIVAAIGTGAAVFLRKRGGVATWLDQFWAGQVQPPAAFLGRMTDGCTWLVDGGDIVSAPSEPALDIACNPGSDIRAPTDCIVSWVGTIAGRGPSVGLSSLHVSDESFLFIGIEYMVGLGQFVTGDEVIGQPRPGPYRSPEALLTFRVVNAMLPDPNGWQETINARTWLRENGTQVTRYIRGWA